MLSQGICNWGVGGQNTLEQALQLQSKPNALGCQRPCAIAGDVVADRWYAVPVVRGREERMAEVAVLEPTHQPGQIEVNQCAVPLQALDNPPQPEICDVMLQRAGQSGR